MDSPDRRPEYLRWPSPERLGQRLSDAEEQRLIVAEAPVKKNHQVDGFTAMRFMVTPQLKPDPYSVRVYFGPDQRDGTIYAHCACEAGQHGIACKHLAAALDTLWDIESVNHLRVLHIGEHDEFLHEGKKPED